MASAVFHIDELKRWKWISEAAEAADCRQTLPKGLQEIDGLRRNRIRQHDDHDVALRLPLPPSLQLQLQRLFNKSIQLIHSFIIQTFLVTLPRVFISQVGRKKKEIPVLVFTFTARCLLQTVVKFTARCPVSLVEFPTGRWWRRGCRSGR